MKSRSVSVSLFIVLFTYKLPVARRISSPCGYSQMSVLILIKLFIILIINLVPGVSFLPPPPVANMGKRETLGKRLFKKEDHGSSACFLNAFGGKDLMDMYTIHTKTIPNDKK